MSVTSTMGVGIADAAGAVARCMLGGGVICGAASAAAAAYAAYRVYTSGDGSLLSDPGVPPVVNTGARRAGPFADGNYYTGATPYDVAIAAAPGEQSYWRSHGYPSCTVTPVNPNPSSSSGYRTYSSCNSNGTFSFSTTATTTSTCPASIDPTNAAYNVPEGSPVGPDGKCPTARYNHVSITAEAAAGKVAANPPSDPSPWKQATQDAIDSGGQSAPSGISTTGPASQTGTPKQTVKTEGTTTTTTTETPTYNYNYAGDTITYNTTNVTNVTINNNGTVTTSTTTTTGGAATPQDPTDPCTANPDRIGCKTAGTVAPQPDLYTKKTKTFDDVLADFKAQINASPLGTATGGFFNVSGGGTCPTWSAHIPFIGADVTIDQFCSDFASNALALLKAVVLVVSSLVAFRVAVL